MELTVMVVILSQPALALVRLWLRKHIVTSGQGVTTDAARVATQLL
jgi:hypothetical protein